MFREWVIREWCARKNGGQPVGGTLEAQQAVGEYEYKPKSEQPNGSDRLDQIRNSVLIELHSVPKINKP